MFVKLTNLKGDFVFVNTHHIIWFTPQGLNKSTHIQLRDSEYVIVKESPEEILACIPL